MQYKPLVFLPLQLNNELARLIFKLSKRNGCSVACTIEQILKEYLDDIDFNDDFSLKREFLSSGENISNRQKIGIKVCQLRQMSFLSQSALGQCVGLNQRTISRIEAGERKIDLLEAVALAHALGVELDELITPL